MQHSGSQLNHAYYFGQLRKFIRNDEPKTATQIGEALGDLYILEKFISEISAESNRLVANFDKLNGIVQEMKNEQA